MPGPGYSAFGDEERTAVLAVLERWAATRTTFGDPGEAHAVARFERTAAATFGSGHCLSTNSGTSALLAALAALGIGPGDEVIVPGYMFVASIAAVIHSGADPVIAEVDDSLTLDPADVAARITDRTRAIMAVHMLGAGCDLDALAALARTHSLALIEDCAQATGGTHRGARLGTIGEIGTFSLNHYKVITALDGGFLLTDDPRLFQRAYSFHDQGWYPYRSDTGEGDAMVGLNLRMPEFNAAVGLAQLGKLDALLARLRSRRTELVERIGELPGVSRRRSHDAEGDCATLAVYLFDDPDRAAAVAAALGTTTLIASGKHYYGGLPEVAAFCRGDARPAPFRAPIAPAAEQDLAPGALAGTDAVLSRAVAVAVGVSDDYLGAGFGLSAEAGAGQIAQVAARFRTVALTARAAG